MQFWNKTKQTKQITHKHSIDLFIHVNLVNVFISKQVFGLLFQRSLEQIKNKSNIRCANEYIGFYKHHLRNLCMKFLLCCFLEA